MSGKDLIIGLHSIAGALRNPRRFDKKLVATKDGLSELRKRENFADSELNEFEILILDNHQLQEAAKKAYDEFGFNYQRVPSNIFMTASSLPVQGAAFLYNLIEENPAAKLLCLDQVTDVHNAAAIMRTAAFYGVDCLIVSRKGNFGLSPSYFRIASGATEYLPLVNCPSLPKVLNKIKDKGIQCVGFSEHADVEAKPFSEKGICLIMGSEDFGLSHAVQRCLDLCVKLQPHGPIKSLNVSVAAAIAMEKFFS